jgi:hypothetical protein
VWSGTRDRSPFVAMGDAMDFRCVQLLNKLAYILSYENMASFAKTGSGQTDGKLTQHRLFLFLFLCLQR